MLTGDLRLKYDEVRKFDGSLVYCDKQTNQKVYKFSAEGAVDAVLIEDGGNAEARLEQYKVEGDCPTEMYGTKLSYVSDQEKAAELVAAVHDYFEARALRYFYYFPLFFMVIIVLFCAILFVVIKLGNQCYLGKRAEKR